MSKISKYKFTVFFRGASTIHAVVEAESLHHAQQAVKAMYPGAFSYLFTGKED